MKKLVVGKLTTRTTIGRMAEFCPVCREVRPCHALRVKDRLYANLVPLEPGTPAGIEALCEVCQFSFPTREEEYLSLVSDFRLDLATLIRTTHPEVAETRAPQLELAHRIRRGEVRGAERLGLIQGTIRLLEPTARRVRENSRVDGPGMFALSVFLISIASVGIVLPEARPRTFPMAVVVWGVVVIGSLVSSVYFAATNTSRFMRRHVEAKVALALLPLRPDHLEIVAAIDALAVEGLFIARHLDAQRISAILREAAPSESPAQASRCV